MEETDAQSYTPPVSQLLSYEEPDVIGAKGWPDYLALGFSAKDIPELTRLAIDKELLNTDSEELSSWGPIHAWRTLGQLHQEAIAAVESLLTIPAIMDDSEWALDELPQVFALIGPDTIPILNSALVDVNSNYWTRAMVIGGLEQIALRLPEQRATVVQLLIEQMERMEKLPSFEENDYELNSFIINALTRLKAQEALPIIERAFQAKRVDEFINGSWENIQYQFGLITKEEFEHTHPSMDFLPFESSVRQVSNTLSPAAFEIVPPDVEGKPRSSSKAKIKKNKQKMAQKSKKKNRRR